MNQTSAKPMKVAFYLGNANYPNTDFRNIVRGNPGVGYSDYLPVALAAFLQKNYPDAIEPVIFANFVKNMPAYLSCKRVQSVSDAVEMAALMNIELFVFRTRIDEEDSVLATLNQFNISGIGVAQLTPSPKHIRALQKCRMLKALVCVGREQYDSMVDTPAFPKLCVIDNAVEISSFTQNPPQKKDPYLVSYLGALTYQKGFQLLAEAWPKVLQQIPSAKLSVIGSAKLYGENKAVGSFGVADEFFENEVIKKYLCDNNGRLHPSVTLHGQMGMEKLKILASSSVGVANPTGQTETCCVSALEFSACSTAVVSGAYYALLTSVQHGRTGLLGRTVDDLANNIISLLKDSSLAQKMGDDGLKYVASKYSFEVVAPLWISLFNTVSRGEQPKKPLEGYQNIFAHRKFIRIMNKLFQASIGKIFWWPSLIDLESWLWRLRRRLRPSK